MLGDFVCAECDDAVRIVGGGIPPQKLCHGRVQMFKPLCAACFNLEIETPEWTCKECKPSKPPTPCTELPPIDWWQVLHTNGMKTRFETKAGVVKHLQGGWKAAGIKPLMVKAHQARPEGYMRIYYYNEEFFTALTAAGTFRSFCDPWKKPQ